MVYIAVHAPRTNPSITIHFNYKNKQKSQEAKARAEEERRAAEARVDFLHRALAEEKGALFVCFLGVVPLY